MARRVGLPSPTLTPFGGGARSFSQYDLGSSDSSRDDGYEFQKAQALWAAGKISDDQYLAAYQKYVNGLDKNTSTYVNAKQALERERYTMARNDIVARIEAGDKGAWSALLEYDRNSLSGMASNNEEYQRRLGYLRQTQAAMYSERHADIAQRVQQGQMTQQQYLNWLQAQRNSGLTQGNAALRDSIQQQIDSTQYAVRQERQAKVYQRWQDGEMSPSQFMNYSRKIRDQYKRGTDQHAIWDARLRAAKLQTQDARMQYRWQLSEQYHQNQQELAVPPPTSKEDGTRTVYKNGGWREESIDYAPTPQEQEEYATWQANQNRLKAEQARIERQLGRVNANFADPQDMIDFYKERRKGTAKGTQEWLNLTAAINRFKDTKATWDMFKPENGFFPSRPASTEKTKGKRIPGEGAVNAQTFLNGLAATFSGNSKTGNRYGISNADWKIWAKRYLGDASAKKTPDNLDIVAKKRARDMKQKYGSWALVAKAWVEGSTGEQRVSQWGSGTRAFVDQVWQNMGLGNLPQDFTFDGTVEPPIPVPYLTPTPEGEITVADAAGSEASPTTYIIEYLPGGAAGGQQPREYIKKGKNLEGMSPGEFDEFYDQARNTFIDGDTSFTVLTENGLVNYYFPANLGQRAEMMGQLDATRVALREYEYVSAVEEVAAMNGEASQEQIERVASAADNWTKAVDIAGQNHVALAFAQQVGAEGDGKNYNPAADMKFVADQATTQADRMFEQAQAMWANGHDEQAVAMFQKAQETLANAGATLLQLQPQVDRVVAEAQVEGADLTEEQHAEIAALANFDETYGFTKRSDEIRDWANKEVLPYVATDEDGNIQMVQRDDGSMEIIQAPGSAKVLVHNEGKQDTVDRIFPDASLAPEGYDSAKLDGSVENHIHGAAMIAGRQTDIYMPYKKGVVGYILTEDGDQVPLEGKVINTNIGGRQQVLFENPMRPGTYMVHERHVDEGQPGFVFQGGPGVRGEQDEQGNKYVVWEQDGHEYTLSPNAETLTYNVTERYLGGWMPTDSPEQEARVIGNLSDSPMLQTKLGDIFSRDVSRIPAGERVAADTDPIAGMSAKEMTYHKQSEQWRKEAQARLAGQARAAAVMKRDPKDPFGILSFLGNPPAGARPPAPQSPEQQPIGAEPIVTPAPSPTPTPMPSPRPSASPTPRGTPITMPKPGASPFPILSPSPQPGSKPTATPKPTPTPPAKPPSYNKGPLIL